MSGTKEINDLLTSRQYRRFVAAEDSWYSGFVTRTSRFAPIATGAGQSASGALPIVTAAGAVRR
ncbi:hypothetical protein GCM10010317_097830 [Streptomyces mirabilis]|jgi:hypothetical protein|nr:hypothetical protein GCM10010317_097830 [Streptomyces mirabilis]